MEDILIGAAVHGVGTLATARILFRQSVKDYQRKALAFLDKQQDKTYASHSLHCPRAVSSALDNIHDEIRRNADDEWYSYHDYSMWVDTPCTCAKQPAKPTIHWGHALSWPLLATVKGGSVVVNKTTRPKFYDPIAVSEIETALDTSPKN